MMRLDITLVGGLSERIIFQLTDADGHAVNVTGYTWAGYYREAGGATEAIKVEHEGAESFAAEFPAKPAGGGAYEIYQFDGSGDGELLLSGQVVVLPTLGELSMEDDSVLRRFRVQMGASGEVLQVRALPCTAAELVYRRGQELLDKATLQAQDMVDEVRGAMAEVLAPSYELADGAEGVVRENVIYFVRDAAGSYARYMLVNGRVVALADVMPPAGQVTEVGALIADGNVTPASGEVFAPVVARTDGGSAVVGHGVPGATHGRAGAVKLSQDFFGNNETYGATIHRAKTFVAGLVKVALRNGEMDIGQMPDAAPDEAHVVPTVECMEEHVGDTVKDLRELSINPLNAKVNILETRVMNEAVVVKRGANYRQFADGFVEVWGTIPAPSKSGVQEWNTGVVAPDVAFAETGLHVQLTPMLNRRTYYTNDVGWLISSRIDDMGVVHMEVYAIAGVSFNVRVSGWVEGTEFDEG